MVIKKPKGKAGHPVVKHGAYSYLTRLTVPDNRAYLRPYLSGVREGLIKDLGPTEEDLTTAQKLIIDRIISQAGVIRLIEEHCREQGIFHGMAITPALAENYLAYANSLRLNLQALGIKTKAGEKILGPLEIAAEIDREQAEQDALDAEKAVPEAPGGPEMPQDGRSPEDSRKGTGDSDDVPGGEKDDKGGEDNG